jgi:ribonuclease R
VSRPPARSGPSAGRSASTRNEALVAVVEKRGKFLVAEPFFGPGPRLALSRDSRYDVGDLVAVSAGVSGRGGKGQRAKVLRRIGRPDNARAVIEALMIDRGLARGFDPSVARAAKSAAEEPIEATAILAPDRRDLRQLPTLTIDPTTAKDFDDAISCEPEEGGWRVWVHIADVSAYVTPRSPIDREAYRRGTSVYVPGAVEPMLPFELSNGVCSLVPNEDRLAVTVEMTVRGEEVTRASFYRSLIRSDQRLTYDQVDEFFSGSARAPGAWGEALGHLRAASAALGRRRASKAAIVLESSEPEVSFDKKGNVAAITQLKQTESHRLIEHLMIAANEQVAKFLGARKAPTLYRIHEPPEAMAVERMVDQLAELGVPTPAITRGPLTPQQAAEAAGEASVMVAEWVAKRGGVGARALNRIVLRSLKQALYDDHNRGHSGLQLESYCHFTSPIRRYPDLICHRALLAAVGAATEAGPEASFVAAAGPICSANERHAMTIERDGDDIARCFLLAQVMAAGGDRERVFDGEIVGVIGAGAFISFGEHGEFEGMMPVRVMRGDWYSLNEHATALVGERGGALRLGDPVKVQVGSIDAPRGRVDLLPVDSDG